MLKTVQWHTRPNTPPPPPSLLHRPQVPPAESPPRLAARERVKKFSRRPSGRRKPCAYPERYACTVHVWSRCKGLLCISLRGKSCLQLHPRGPRKRVSSSRAERAVWNCPRQFRCLAFDHCVTCVHLQRKRRSCSRDSVEYSLMREAIPMS